jgi:cytoskeletal protein CcmA (bactofilin family)
MFSKTNTPKNTPEAPRKTSQKPVVSVPSIFGRDLIVTGDIKTDGDLQIDGRHEGNITASKLTIGEHGAVNGLVDAKTIHVRGKITGKIRANNVELAETANVQADIVQDHLTIANGAFFDGKCSRLTKNKPAAAPAQRAPAAAAKKPAR